MNYKNTLTIISSVNIKIMKNNLQFNYDHFLLFYLWFFLMSENLSKFPN